MQQNVTGGIAPGHLYQVAEIRHRLGLGEWAWRRLMRAGLKSKVFRLGRRAYLRSDDFFEFLSQASASDGGGEKE